MDQKRWIAALAMTLAACGASAAEWAAVEGTYALTAENYLDPAETEPRDSHIRFQLSGRTAKELFMAMKVPEATDECTGAMARRVGEMLCLRYEGPEHYECAFSVNVMKQTIHYGVSC